MKNALGFRAIAAMTTATAVAVTVAMGAQAAKPPAPPSPAVPAPQVDPNHTKRNPASFASPSQVPANNPALVQLARERAGLELVDHAAQQALTDATKRVAAMHAYIEAKGGTAQYSRYADTYQSHGAQISFQTALDRAMDHLASRPVPPPTTDLSQLELAAQVENAAAHASFNQLNSMRRSAEMLSSFLAVNHALADYQQWAAQHPASKAGRDAAASASGSAGADRAAAANATAAAHDRRVVQLAWDSAQQAQTAQAQAAQAQAAQYPPSPDPGKAVAHGPYSSSWWNSYADPYYDLAGYPSKDPTALQPVPPENFGSTGPPVNYDWATSGYNRTNYPYYWDLGPNVYPSFGMFPSGAAGGASFGPGGGGGHGGGGGGR